jgi:predicted DNA-binding transcriptional regulator YafY
MKLDRLLAITMLLLNRKRISAKEMSERFEVSLRTIYRDVETIQYAGIPVVSYAGASGGYEIMDRYRLERQFLSLEELHSIVIALRGIKATMDDRDIGLLLDKVGALMAKPEQVSLDEASERLVIDINPWNSGQEDKEKLAGLREAIRDNRVIRFAYTNGEGDQSSRTCEPMRLVLKGYVWYVYGYCLLREDFRIFRLSRVRDLELTHDTFVRRPEPSADDTLRWERGTGSQGTVDLVLLFAAKMRARVEDNYGSDRIENRPDGTMLVKVSQPDEPWLYGFLLGFGADLKVMSPSEVAARMREKALEIAKLYAEN